ncbi:PAS domain S-box protein, partial [Chloroflexota bacterium]
SVFVRDITERKKAEMEYQTIVGTAMDGFAIHDMQGHFLDANDAYCGLTGYSRDELMNMSFQDLEVIEQPADRTERIRRMVKETGYDRFEDRLRCKDGETVDVDISANYLPVDGGRFFVFLRDITERKRAEEVLAEEATRRRILMDQSRDGISILDENSKLVEANQRFAEMLGYTPEELSDFHTWDWDAQWKREELFQMGQNVDEAGVHLETSHRRKDGTVFDVELSVNRVVVGGKKLLFCVSRDVTDRRQAEESLRRSEQNFRDSMENSPLGIRILYEDGKKTVYANQAMLDMWGYSSIEELEAVPRKQRYTPECYDEHIKIVEKRRRGEPAPLNYEISIVRGDGQVRTLSISRGETLWGGEKRFQLVYQDITERKQAEEVIKESEDKYRRLFELSSDALFLIEVETGKILDLNNASIAMYGYSREEALQMKNTDFSAEPDETHKSTLESEEYVTLRYHRKKGGLIFPVEISVAYYTWYGKQVCLAAIRDITERKQVEENLRESEERYRVLVELSPEAIFVAVKGEHVFVNSAGLKLLGASSPDQIIGKPVMDIIHPDYRELVADRMRKAIETGIEAPVLEEKFVRLDGTVIDVEVRGAPLIYRGKEAIQVFVSDITERKRAEEALRLSEQNLRNSIENSPLGIRIADKDGKSIYANRALLDIWGYSSIGELEAVPRKQRYTLDSYDEHRIRVDKRGRGEYGPSNYEIGIVRSDGQVRVLSVSRGDLLWGGEKIFQLVYQDITELKRAARELEKAVEELQRSNAELEQFAYVASHDLQEPLRMVSSYTQLLERRYKDKLDADANDFINYAVGGAERMHELINDLLTYSRVGTRAKPFKGTDMEAVLEAALDNLQVAIKESKAKVSHGPLPTVMADEGQMIQVFQNLIGNAIKFRGEKSPRIHVSAEQRDSEWVFSVKDNGIGIEPQYFDRVFLIFQRLHRDEYPGTGTGLAIAKKIVERHGGQIWIESQPGKGSTFYFRVKATGERQQAIGKRQKA